MRRPILDERMIEPDAPPLFRAKDHDQPSVFKVENLIREARRQRDLQTVDVPEVCLLVPDGDTIRHLREAGRATRLSDWACYHSEMRLTEVAGARSASSRARSAPRPPYSSRDTSPWTDPQTVSPTGRLPAS